MVSFLKAATAPGDPQARVIGISDIAGPMVKVSKRGWLRLCEQGKAPFGFKLGARRLWDRQVIEKWISDGCPAVGRNGGNNA